MATQDFTIAIIGAGIGGLALAIGLTRHGIPFTVYESAPAFSTLGAGIGLGPNSLRAMDLLDPRFRRLYMGIATGNLRPEKKHSMMEALRMERGLGEEECWWGGSDWGAPDFERTGAHRKDLLDVMTSLIDRETVRFGRTVVGIVQGNDKVSLTFADGSVATHAAVVGCGGIRGIERRAVLGEQYPDCVEPQYTNKYAYRGILSIEAARQILGDLATDAKMYMSRTSNISTYPISQGKQVNVVAFKRDPNPWTHPSTTHQVDRKTMMEDFSDIELDDRLLRLLELIPPTQWPLFHHSFTPTYYTSLIALLGDCAHASTPHQAASAGQALEDALILSHALSTLPPSLITHSSPARTKAIEAAFKAYDEVRRPRAQKQVQTARQCGDVYNLQDPSTGAEMSVEEVVKELNGRFGWIWGHDLEADVERVQKKVGELMGR